MGRLSRAHWRNHRDLLPRLNHPAHLPILQHIAWLSPIPLINIQIRIDVFTANAQAAAAEYLCGDAGVTFLEEREELGDGQGSGESFVGFVGEGGGGGEVVDLEGFLRS